MEAKVIPVFAVAMSREDACELETWLGTRITLGEAGEKLLSAITEALNDTDWEHE